MNIKLHIERLVLDGVDISADQSRLLQVGVETELTRLLAERGISPALAQGIAVPRVSAPGLELTDKNPTRVGRQIAQSVYGGIGHE